MFIEPEQIRAARAMLGWSQQELAEAASVSKDTVKNYEVGNNRPNSKTLLSLETALTTAGMEFPRDGGVRPIRGRIRRIEGTEGFRLLMDMVYKAYADDKNSDVIVTNIREDLFLKWLGDYEPFQRKRMAALGTIKPLRVILSDQQITHQNVPYLDFKYIDKQYFGDTTIYSFKKTVAILEMNMHNCVVNIIENEIMSDTFNKLLSLMWDSSKRKEAFA